MVDGRELSEKELAARHERMARLILGLRARGIGDTQLLSAIEATPRDLFLAARDRPFAGEDRPFPIECGQTISAPSVVAVMLDALRLEPEHKMLEVGSGSGYAAAIAARLVRQIYCVERYRTLVDLAKSRFATLKLSNIEAYQRDGHTGDPLHAPFDRILVSAATPDIPSVLVAQLVPEGILVAPVGPAGGTQRLLRVVKTDPRPRIDDLGAVRFVPMVSGVAKVM